MLRFRIKRDHIIKLITKPSLGWNFQCNTRLCAWWAIPLRHRQKNVLWAWHRWNQRFENFLHRQTQRAYLNSAWWGEEWASKSLFVADKSVWKQRHWYYLYILLQYFEIVRGRIIRYKSRWATCIYFRRPYGSHGCLRQRCQRRFDSQVQRHWDSCECKFLRLFLVTYYISFRCSNMNIRKGNKTQV